MRKVFEEISDRILENALGALKQANMHSAFFDPGNEHWGNISVLNAVHAGELVIKAIIAREHPLLVFKNVFDFSDTSEEEVALETLVKKGRSHDFQNLPKVMKAVCDVDLPDSDSFVAIREMRNSIQHFFHPSGLQGIGDAARTVSLDFIYKNVDPLLFAHFGLYAIEFHEDHSIGYDYLVSTVVGNRLKFSVPDNFNLTEIRLSEHLNDTKSSYYQWIESELARVGRLDLLGPTPTK